MKRRSCKHVMCRTCMQKCSHMPTSSVSAMPASWEIMCCWAHHPFLSTTSVSQTPTLGSDASPPPTLLTQLSYPWILHACRANDNYFLYIYFYFLLHWFGIVLNCIIQNNSYCLHRQYFSINYLRQMHQIIHLSPVGCFTPARCKTVQKNREVSGVMLCKLQHTRKSRTLIRLCETSCQHPIPNQYISL